MEEFDRAFRNAIEIALLNFPKIRKLKLVQEEALSYFIQRRDVFSVLPTGCGKSLIFQLVPRVCACLNDQGYSHPKNAMLLVVCPLNSLIDAHIEELKDHGISACFLGQEGLEEEDVSKHYLTFLRSAAPRETLQKQTLSKTGLTRRLAWN